MTLLEGTLQNPSDTDRLTNLPIYQFTNFYQLLLHFSCHLWFSVTLLIIALWTFVETLHYYYRFLFFLIFKFISNSNYKSLWTSLMRNKVNQPSLKFKTKPLEFVISYAPYSNSSLNFFPYSCASWLKAKTTLSVSGPSSFSEQL